MNHAGDREGRMTDEINKIKLYLQVIFYDQQL
jgi:hypothetical protein